LRLYSYVVARDFGFAPNPFFGICTLATCKPEIRRLAKVGDWVVGTGSARSKRTGYLVYAFRVSEVLSFQSYWSDPRYQVKKPNLRGSKKVAFGDNIYSKEKGKDGWCQANSHHSLPDGSPNIRNIENDTQTDCVLIGAEFVYWGGNGPKIPANIRKLNGFDLCAGRGHKSKFAPEHISAFVKWVREANAFGYLGEPLDWKSTP
jgi:hypothetical protein